MTRISARHTLAVILLFICCLVLSHSQQSLLAQSAGAPSAAAEALAARLVAAETDEERQRILREERESFTVELREALVRQSSQLISKGDPSRALTVLQLAHKVAEQTGDTKGVAAVLVSIGNFYRRRGDYAQAMGSYQKSLAVSETLNDKPGIADALNGIGLVYQSQNDYARSMEHFQKALELSEAVSHKNGTANILNNMGNVHYLRGDYPQAMDSYRKSLTLKEALGIKDETVTNTLNNIGVIHRSQGNYALAFEYLRKSLTLSEAAGNKPGIALALRNIAIIYESQGDYPQALEYYRKSLEMREALGDKPEVANTLISIGVTYALQSNYAQALDFYQKGMALYEALGNKRGISAALNNMGIVYQWQGDYGRAMEHYHKSLALKEALGDKNGVASSFNNLGIVHRLQGNYPQAMEYHQKSLALEEALGDKDGIAKVLNSMGRVYELQGDYARAMEHYQKSLALKETLGDKDGIAGALNNIGNVYLAQGDYTRAMEYYQKSLALKENLGDRDGIAIALTNIGRLHYKQGRHTQAVDFANRAAALALQVGSRNTYWYGQLHAGRAYISLGQMGPARQALTEAINTIESMRAQVAGTELDAQRFFENRLAPYLAMADLLIRENKYSEALTYAERAKARVLLDVLRGGRFTVSKAMSAGEREEEQRLRAEMNSLNARLHRSIQSQKPDQARIGDLNSLLQKARLEYEAFQDKLYAAHPELKAQRGEAPLFSLEQASQLLPDAKTALFEYLVTDDAVYLFVLTAGPGGGTARDGMGKPVLKVYDLKVKRQDLAARVQSLRQRIANNDLEIAALSADLYDLLVRSAKTQLEGKTRLVIVPDGVLWEMPFQALRPAGGKYLVQTSAISYAPSLTVLREMMGSKSKRAAGGTLLAIGNPQLAGQTIARSKSVLMSASLEPLPDAERMVKSLAQIYGAAASRIYTGASAREDVLKAESGNFRILQLATHGVLNDSSPMYSHLVLSQDDGAKDDGLLEAWEMMSLDLKADLVVLSACDTARGRIGAGEGVIGMTWALFVGGSPTTVVGQWKVESSSTTELMLEFHRNLKGGAGKSEAMRRAAMKLITDKRYEHPFYWAGFIVVGDGD